MTLATNRIEIRLLGADDASVLDRVADEVFDHAIDPRWSAEFFADPRHHLVVALDGDLVVGMATGFHYVHPDKPPQLWINEVGVSPAWRRRGVATALLERVLELADELECTDVWLLTERENLPARALYESMSGMKEGEAVVLFERDR